MLKRLLKAAFGASALAVILGALSAYLPPAWFWWTGPLASLLPATATLGACAAAAALLWAARTRRLGWLASAAALLILISVRVGPQVSISAAAGAMAPGEDELRVMSLNTPGQNLDRYASAQDLVAFVERARPRIIALQEADLHEDSTGQYIGTTSQIVGLISQLEYRPPALPPYPAVVEQPLLGKVPMDSVMMHRFPFPWGVLKPTDVTVTRFAWDGQVATLINVHLHTVMEEKPWRTPGFRWYHPADWAKTLRAYREGALRRAAEARRVRQLMDAVDGPLIVTGDFNSTPYNWAYHHLARGMHDAFTAAGRGLGYTYPAGGPLVRIDYVLASNHWEVVEAWVPDATTLSDHRPVLADLRLRNGSE